MLDLAIPGEPVQHRSYTDGLQLFEASAVLTAAYFAPPHGKAPAMVGPIVPLAAVPLSLAAVQVPVVAHA